MKMFHVAFLVAAAALGWLLAPAPVLADNYAMEVITPDEIRWEAPPPGLPAGAEFAVLLGDPSQPGPFVVRMRIDGEYIVPPHYHSRAESLTVLSGTLYLGGGEQWDPTSAHLMEAGAFHYLPARTPHFAFTKGPVLLEIHGEGPFDIIYLHREDDPRNKPMGY